MKNNSTIKICLIVMMFLFFAHCLPSPDGGDSGDGGATDSIEWEQITTTSVWSARSGHQAVVFNDEMWVMGGYDGTNRLNDIWHSKDGVEWRETETKEITSVWSARSGHQAVVFNDEMWVMGGYDGTNRLNDIWHSKDGVEWIKVEIDTPLWQVRSEHLILVFNDDSVDNKMWVIGGSSGNERLNDVWHSTDGKNWAKKDTYNPMWDARTSHTGAVFRDKMWVIDGYGLNNYKNDIWSSKSGSRWIKEVNGNEWCSRMMSFCVVYDEKLWIMGGFSSSSNLFNDVWYSIDGKNWVRVVSISEKWSPRYSMSVVVFVEKMWVLGGAIVNEQRSNEVWRNF